MSTPVVPKPRGRPRLHEASLNRDRILSTASQLLAAGAADVNMRAVASALEVNAMALYHYFPNKQALRDALVEQAFAPLFAIRPRLVKLRDPERRLWLLATTYLRCATRALPLTRHLAGRAGAPLAMDFTALFDETLGIPMSKSSNAQLRDVLVDYLHGVALAGPKTATRALTSGWPILMSGFHAHLALNVGSH